MKPSIWSTHPAAKLALLTSLGLGLTFACRMPQQGEPVPVEGEGQAVSRFAGEWRGRYWSKDTGRHGDIRFTMPERADTGYGEVEITFSPALSMAEAASGADKSVRPVEDAENPEPCPFLNIRLVRVEDDQVRGTLAPYWDPDCNCRAQTVFEGKISGARITGSFVTRRESSDKRLLSGQWQVDRGDSKNRNPQ